MSAERFPVEAGHIMMFARAIGDPNPAYYGGSDLVSDLSDVVAPPTFTEASLHYDRAFPYRPRIGEQWFGSAAQSSSGPAPKPAAGPDESGGTSFHAETHLEYFELLHSGDILDVSEHPGESWQRAGSRGGQLWFDSYIADFTRAGSVVVRCTTVVVTTETRIDPVAGLDASGTSDVVSLARSVPVGSVVYPIPAVSAGDLSVGDVHERVLVQNLTRAQILMYAGASGDFSPQHTDEIWNTEVAGYPSTFAHGMLTMGMTGRLLTDWFGNSPLRAFSMRFSRQVWPGDDLIASSAIRAVTEQPDGTDVELELRTTNGRGQMVASGNARVELR